MSQKILQSLEINATMIPFSMKEKLNEGGYSVDNELVVKLQEDFRMKISIFHL